MRCTGLHIVHKCRSINAGALEEELHTAVDVARQISDTDEAIAALLVELTDIGHRDVARELLVPVGAVDQHRGVGQNLLSKRAAVLLRVSIVVSLIKLGACCDRFAVVLRFEHNAVHFEATALVLERSLSISKKDTF